MTDINEDNPVDAPAGPFTLVHAEIGSISLPDLHEGAHVVNALGILAAAGETLELAIKGVPKNLDVRTERAIVFTAWRLKRGELMRQMEIATAAGRGVEIPSGLIVRLDAINERITRALV